MKPWRGSFCALLSDYVPCIPENLDSGSSLPTFVHMLPKTKASTAAKLRWRVAIMRSRAHILGIVSAPDREAAETVAIAAFDLNEHDRRRLLVREE